MKFRYATAAEYRAIGRESGLAAGPSVQIASGHIA